MTAYREIDGKTWAWPEFDTELVRVFDQVNDVHEILNHVGRFRTCIQAGGACGIWPLMFSQYFDNVHTFEPSPENFDCLLDNCREGNIWALNFAVGDERKNIGLTLDACEATNAGAWYATDTGTIKMVTIDSLNIDDVDLIQLDVEGMEFEALQGAMDTIAKHLPTIVLEEKNLPHMTRPCALAREWLERRFGYSVVHKIHRDVVLRVL